MYIRKTMDEIQVQGFYADYWEEVYTGTTKRDALDRLKEYRANEAGIPFRVKTVRVPKLDPVTGEYTFRIHLAA